MATVVTINSVDKTTLVRPGSIEIEESLGGRTTCRFEIVDKTQSYRPTRLQTVGVQVDGVYPMIFYGVIVEIEERPAIDNKGTVQTITCQDMSYNGDRVICTYTWTASQTLKQLVSSVISLWLQQFGTALNGSQIDGPTIASFKVEWITGTEVLNLITKETGWIWDWDMYNTIRFMLPTVTAFPVSLSTSNTLAEGLSVRYDISKYRNRQYVLYNNGAAALQAYNQTEINNYGEYQAYTEAREIINSSEAQALADGLLARYGTMAKLVTVGTRIAGFRKGMSGTIDIPTKNINAADGTYVVQGIVHRHLQALWHRRWGQPDNPNDASAWVHELTCALTTNAVGGYYYTDEWMDLISGGSSGGSGSGSGVVIPSVGGLVDWTAYLGGSRTIEMTFAVSPAWTPVPDYVEVVLDSTRFASAVVNCRCWVKTLNTGTSVQPRITCVDTGGDVGHGSSTNSVAWEQQTFSLTLVSGVKKYRLDLLATNNSYPVLGLGVLYV